ncbi:MAG TPA: hypothetical protein VIB39_22195 [Candidatus Angelobacter sp.]|jgi:hypothetical protein
MAEETPRFCDNRFSRPITSLMTGFLSSIGLETAPAVLSQETFLPGLMISHGILLIDEARLTYPGDVLHEAGHIAVTPAAQRRELHQSAGSDAGEEMAAIAWSYAAALYIGIDLAIVFHADGYRGSSPAIVENFSQGRYLGVPLLEWYGLTAGRKEAASLQIPSYPHMLRWLRD